MFGIILKWSFLGRKNVEKRARICNKMNSMFKTTRWIFIKIISSIKQGMICISVSGKTKSFNREDVVIISVEDVRKNCTSQRFSFTTLEKNKMHKIGDN